MHVEGGVVLDHHMNIAEVPFQWVAAVDRIGSGRLEHDIDRANRFMDRVGDGQSGACDGEARIGAARAVPDRRHRFEHEGSGSTENGLGFRDARLHGGAIP